MGGLLWALFIGLGGLPYSQLIQILGSGTRTALWLAFAQAAAAVIRLVTGSAPLTLTNAVSHAIKSLTQYGLCTQSGTPTPDAPVDIVCNNGVLTKPHDTYTAVDGQGTYASPGAAANRIYKAFDVGDGKYTISVPTAYDFIVQYKTPADGSTPTDSGNITSWVNGLTTVTLNKGTAYGYGIALRDHVNQSGNISPSDFSGTIVVVHDDEPVEAVGTSEVLSVGGANLFDASSYAEINAYVNANTGVLTAGSPGSITQYCVVIPCKPNAQYNITGRGTSAWGAFPSDSIGTAATEFNKGGILTTGPNDRYLIGLVRANGDAIDYRNTLVVQESQTVTDIPMLLSVGDYKDEGEIISGLLTHKVGVKVFDGTEDWQNISGYYNIAKTALGTNSTVLPAASTNIICTHYETISGVPNRTSVNVGGSYINFRDDNISTLIEFKQYLAAQYAAGTPVIVVYPLATETTEQTTPHSLHTTEGTNIIDVTSNVSPTQLSVEYAAKA